MKNLITCLTVSLLCGATFATTWTVDDDGKADFNNIQAAVNAASDGDTINVAPGTYTSDTGEVVFMGGKNIILQSTELHGAVIDGQGTRRGITCTQGEPASTLISGFVIQNCHTDGGGGGFLMYQSSLTISNCKILNNSANTGGGVLAEYCNSAWNDCEFENNIADINGGAMYNNSSSPTLTDCTFTTNTANNGGGMRNDYGSNPTLTGCTFENNTAADNGGGMFNENDSSPTLTNCTFTTNTAANGGGMGNQYDSNPTLDGCTFTSNTATNDGGGMGNWTCGSATLTNCNFTNNAADDDGGGMFNVNSNPTLTNTTVCANTPDQIVGNWTDNGGNTIAEFCWPDCNENGIDDAEDIANQTSSDCDQNSVPDECQPDCDGDGWIDPCDILYGGETDYNDNDIPDNCEPDCNENGIPDDWEIENGLATDCNENGIPDECDLANSGQVPEGAVQWTIEEGGNGHWYYAVNANTSVTWNEASDLADALGGYLATPVYEHENVWIISTFLDDESLWGNGNGYSYGPHLGGWQNPDSPVHSEPDGGWEWITGEPFSYTNWINLDDCCGGQDRLMYFRNNHNNGIWDYGWEDVHQNSDNSLFHSYIVEFVAFDCNDDGFIDSCQIEDDPSLDCDANGILDSCDLMTDPSIDCNGDGAIDICQIDDDPSLDCNANGILDSCDLTTDPNIDCNDDGLIDSCQIDDDSSLDCNGNDILDSCELAGAVPPEGAVQWTIEEGGNGHWYYFLELSPSQSPEHHFAIAESMSGHTVTFSSAEENQFCFNLINGDPLNTTIIGVRKEAGTNQGAWVTGESWGYTNWHSGEGNNSSERYAIIWNDNGIQTPQWLDTDLLPRENSIVEWEEVVAGNDCNSNGIPDECDIADGTSMDQDNDGIPDECEVDCNGNGVPDHWDIKTGESQDCNANGVPDECDIADNTSNDVNENDIPDECEPDCNGNGIPDAWDIETGAAIDCNENGIPDSCDVAAGCVSDCNLNGVPDECDIASGASNDINENNIPDECECSEDLNGDGAVGTDDLLLVIGYWGTAGPLGDFNADNTVGVSDLLILIDRWGECTNESCLGIVTGVATFDDPTDTIDFDESNTNFTDALTYEAHIMLTGYPEEGAVAAIWSEQHDSLEHKSFGIQSDGSFGGVWCCVGEFDQYSIYGGFVPLQVWTHIAVSRDANEWRLYIDGQLVHSTPASGGSNDSGPGSNMAMGAFPHDSGFCCDWGFNGEINWMRISSSTRYSGTSFQPPSECDVLPDTDTELLLNFNETATTTSITDEGPNGFVGILGQGFGSATAPMISGLPNDQNDNGIPDVCE